MRENKFKAWDRKKKEWLTDKDYVYINEEGETFIQIRGAASDYLSRIDVDIVWVTGIKDRNGKEIYESDYVKGVDRYEDEPLEVVYSYAGFCFKRSNGWHLPIPTSYGTFEVVGNIYQTNDIK